MVLLFVILADLAQNLTQQMSRKLVQAPKFSAFFVMQVISRQEMPFASSVLAEKLLLLVVLRPALYVNAEPNPTEYEQLATIALLACFLKEEALAKSVHEKKFPKKELVDVMCVVLDPSPRNHLMPIRLLSRITVNCARREPGQMMMDCASFVPMAKSQCVQEQQSVHRALVVMNQTVFTLIASLARWVPPLIKVECAKNAQKTW